MLTDIVIMSVYITEIDGFLFFFGGGGGGVLSLLGDEARKLVSETQVCSLSCLRS